MLIGYFSERIHSFFSIFVKLLMIETGVELSVLTIWISCISLNLHSRTGVIVICVWFTAKIDYLRTSIFNDARSLFESVDSVIVSGMTGPGRKRNPISFHIEGFRPRDATSTSSDISQHNGAKSRSTAKRTSQTLSLVSAAEKWLIDRNPDNRTIEKDAMKAENSELCEDNWARHLLTSDVEYL
jgi:hypothetical protein